MEPIHQAAWDGDVATLDRLVAEDAGLLDAEVQEGIYVDDGKKEICIEGCTPLILASGRGHDGAVARLLALGADLALLDVKGYSAAHWACLKDQASILGRLLDAGASITDRGGVGDTALICTAYWGSIDCAALLIARGGDALELDTRNIYGITALHAAAYHGHAHIVQLLLRAGADPTIRNNDGDTPLTIAWTKHHQPCITILQAALAEPQRPRLLLEARALIDARLLHRMVTDKLARKGLPPELQRYILALAAPFPYMIGRVERDEPLPGVTVQGASAELVACVAYALREMEKEVFVELCEMLVPKWDRQNL